MEITATPVPRKRPSAPQTVAEFEKWLSRKKTDANYEFVRGRIIRKPPMMQEELFIVDFLVRRFVKTQSFELGDNLLTEFDSYVDAYRKRVPDLAFFNASQIASTRIGERVMPIFTIEVLSDSESQNDVLEKVQDYFDAGVQLVWYIAPKQQKIYAYTSPDDIKVYKGPDVCSAAPVVPDFQFVIQDLFQS
ncbi:Uma2 family endonuclease [Spirosoma pollinicola]|uniref:Uma2 family endonuclease n=1 Tax=Spirosoma pollinicola TaxID=2057025 RepID=A0A2K8ZBN6_9BACT|nr:Uma2 family endonuclease [Spirosoma pollinicola]AUD07270.1 Uma2 family endonuclease [Spirosoma pollinicola]